ncbi:MAG: retroviral-like aspartic protease [Candidatus Levybacteria bacterium]|nr:retroviral-like aspartic protease [Candidatus Levybacteria bacterium]
MRKYPYYIPQSKVYKPWIPVAIGYKKTHRITPAPITALIDSGSDVCFCSKSIAVFLQVSRKNKERKVFTTANRSKLHTFLEALTLHVGGRHYDCSFYISDELPHETPVILGQLGFFDHHRITFDLENKEIEITYNLDN